MSNLKTGRTAVCVAALFAGNAALADVTAQQVWDNWSGMLAVYGEEGLSIGSEQMSGDTLTVSGISLTYDTPEVTVNGTIDTMTFTENGDGTVTVIMSDEFPITVQDKPNFGPPIRFTLAARSSNMVMTVSGTPEEMLYDLTADRYAIEVDEIADEDQVYPATIFLAMNDVTGRYATTAGDMMSVDYEVSTGSLDVMIDVNDEASETMVMFSGKTEDLAVAASVTMPADLDLLASDNPFAVGFAGAGNYTFGASNYLFNMTEYGDTTNATVVVDGGDLSFDMSADRIDYDTNYRGLQVNAQVPDLPFPVEVGLGEFGFGIAMPTARTDEPVPFGARFTLADLTVSDMIWMMADPAGALPHDPVSINIALSGMARPLFDFLDPEQAMDMAMADLPAELHALSLDTLEVSAVGAGITGSGAFTFDNTDLTMFDGLPRPVGEAAVRVTGANGVMDKLVEMGMLRSEDVMGARMMMGMFATVTGDDQLETSVVVNDQGHLIVNGQRLQ